MTSRRTFLKHASTAAALSVLIDSPARELLAKPPRDLLPEEDDAVLRELALTAVDAARAAGASFADVRVTVGQNAAIVCGIIKRAGSASQLRAAMERPRLRVASGYSVRAIVDGAWGFSAGEVLTADAISQTATDAVALARSHRPRHPRAIDLAPAPQVRNGKWATPIVRDPFAVPLGEQGELALTALNAAAGVLGTIGGRIQVRWQKVTHVFASSEGSDCVQKLSLAIPQASVQARYQRFPPAIEVVDRMQVGGYGYEAFDTGTLVDEMLQAAAGAVERARTRESWVPAEVGRYDLVLSSEAVAGLLVRTVGEALDVERALGYRANQEGSSFAAPPADFVGQYQVGSPGITIHADRSQLGGAATVGWDDEGVSPRNYTIVRNGVIVDYHTSRETAPSLERWYRKSGASLRSHGCVRGKGHLPPIVRIPNLTLEPGPSAGTVDDLIAEVERGFFLDNLGYGASDQQVINSQFSVPWGVREIRNGKLGRPVGNFAFQALTTPLWNTVDALGSGQAARPVAYRTDARDSASRLAQEPFFPPDPLHNAYSTVRAVPALFREVNVLNTGRAG